MRYISSALVALFCLSIGLFLWGKESTVQKFAKKRQTTTASVYQASKGKYIILKRDEPFKEQVKYSNAIYEIKDVYDLKGQAVKIPQSSILCF